MKNYAEMQAGITRQIAQLNNDFGRDVAEVKRNFRIKLMNLEEECRAQTVKLAEERDRKKAELIAKQGELKNQEHAERRERWEKYMQEQKSLMAEMDAHGIKPDPEVWPKTLS